jgi:hypothetical protein
VSIRFFFSGEESGRGAPRVATAARESQQALLLRLLREADGATVSYAELRHAGIELPASIVSELELAGIPIEHRFEGGAGTRRQPGVRLDPALDPERAAEEEAGAEQTAGEPPVRIGANRIAPSVNQLTLPFLTGWTLPFVRRFSLPSVRRFSLPSVTEFSLPSGGRLADLGPARRALAPIALIGAMIVVIAVVVLALQAGGTSSRHRTTHHASNPQSRSTSVVANAPQSSPPPTPSTPVSPALATQFEAQGHDLLESGEYSNAVPVLRRALAATGKQLSDCLEPTSETCLTYAYALYDLGRALELNGEPSAALPVLEQRLQIDNQRDVVAAELAHVRTVAQP